jgi:hypothetical protein
LKQFPIPWVLFTATSPYFLDLGFISKGSMIFRILCMGQVKMWICLPCAIML